MIAIHSIGNVNAVLFRMFSTIEGYHHYCGEIPSLLWMILRTVEGGHKHLMYYLQSDDDITPQCLWYYTTAPIISIAATDGIPLQYYKNPLQYWKSATDVARVIQILSLLLLLLNITCPSTSILIGLCITKGVNVMSEWTRTICELAWSHSDSHKLSLLIFQTLLLLTWAIRCIWNEY